MPALAVSQTFPTAVATNSDLYVASDQATTSLSTSINSSTVSISVFSAAKFRAFNIITIDSEQVKICSISSNVLTACAGGRGFAGTNAVSHNAGVGVFNYVSAIYHNTMSTEVQSIENWLINGQNFIYYAPNFDFPAQSPLTSISPGSNTINLAPVPRGVNHADTKHYLYISGGTGTAESVLIAGGNAVPGAPTGTITFTAANSHSGAYTVRSANCGITEAEYSAPTTGAMIYIPNPCTVHAPIPYKDFMTFAGAAGGTWLTPDSSSGIIFDANVPSNHPNNGLNGIADLVTFQDLVLNGEPFDGLNTAYGIRELLPGGSGDTQGAGISDVNIVNVSCNNVANCLYFQRAWNVYADNLRLYASSKVFFGDVAGLDAFSPFNTTNIVIKDVQTQTYCIKNDCTDGPAFTGSQMLFSHTEQVTIKDAVMNGSRGGVSTGLGAIEFDGGEGSVLDNVLVQLCDLCIQYKPYTGAGHTIYPNSAILNAVSVTQPFELGITIANGTGLGPVLNGPTGFNIYGGQFTLSRPEINPSFATFINVGQFSSNINIYGNTFQSGANAADWLGVSVGANSAHILVRGNTFQNTGPGSGNTSSGVVFGSSVTDAIYNDNTFHDMTGGVSDSGQTIASAATIALPGGRTFYSVTGSTPIATINTCSSTQNTNNVVTFLFGAGGRVNTGGNVTIGSTFGPVSANGTLTLMCTSGSGWFEVSRFVN